METTKTTTVIHRSMKIVAHALMDRHALVTQEHLPHVTKASVNQVYKPVHQVSGDAVPTKSHRTIERSVETTKTTTAMDRSMKTVQLKCAKKAKFNCAIQVQQKLKVEAFVDGALNAVPQGSGDNAQARFYLNKNDVAIVQTTIAMVRSMKVAHPHTQTVYNPMDNGLYVVGAVRHSR